MKKIIYFIASLFCFVSCRDCDFESTHNKQNNMYIIYKNAFESEFGKIPNGQEWDFYAEEMNTIFNAQTRSSNKELFTVQDTVQPYYLQNYNVWNEYLPESQNNLNKGSKGFELISNGDFFIHCVWYYSTNPFKPSNNFDCGIYLDGDTISLFGSYERDAKLGGINPKFSKHIKTDVGIPFKFYVKHNKTGGTFLLSDDQARLFYSKVWDGKQILIIGFEDTPLWRSNCDNDFNDIILYIEGNPNIPVMKSKRFFCEDMGTIGDFDYNDIVFDITPVGDSTDVTIKALGGTLPIELYVGGVCITDKNNKKDLHEILMTNHRQVNVDATNTRTEQTFRIPVKIDNLATFDNVFAYVGTGDNKKIIPYRIDTNAPAIISVPIKTKWTKEFVNIKKAYPKFFSEGWYNDYEYDYIIDN